MFIECHLPRTPHAAGYAIGRRSRPAMQEIAMQTPGWQALAAWRGSKRLHRMQRAAEAAFPRYVEEIQGIADGCGLTFEDAFIWNARGDLCPQAAEGCSTLCIPTRQGFLLGHNEDGLPGFKGKCFISVAPSETDLPAYRAFTYPASINGHTFGVNAYGLVQMVNNIRCTAGGDGVPRMLLARAVLDCVEVDEAVARLRENRRAGAFHHLIAGRREMRAVSVEYAAQRFDATPVDRIYAHANHFIHPLLSGLPQQITASSAARQKQMAAFCAALSEAVDTAAVLKILRDQSHPDLPIYRTDPAEKDQENTLASAVFEMTPHILKLQAHAGESSQKGIPYIYEPA